MQNKFKIKVSISVINYFSDQPSIREKVQTQPQYINMNFYLYIKVSKKLPPLHKVHKEI